MAQNARFIDLTIFLMLQCTYTPHHFDKLNIMFVLFRMAAFKYRRLKIALLFAVY